MIIYFTLRSRCIDCGNSFLSSVSRYVIKKLWAEDEFRDAMIRVCLELFDIVVVLVCFRMVCYTLRQTSFLYMQTWIECPTSNCVALGQDIWIRSWAWWEPRRLLLRQTSCFLNRQEAATRFLHHKAIFRGSLTSLRRSLTITNFMVKNHYQKVREENVQHLGWNQFRI